ncbi:MAG: molybdenum cofactor guanylyltransferase [Aureispira sp.]
MINPNELTAVILTGGQSRRMGQSKALLTLEGVSFVERIAAVASPLVQEVVVVDNGALGAAWKGAAWSDRYQGQGPVAGIETALWNIKTPYALVLSCDIPLMATFVLEYLITNHIPTKTAIFVVQERWQPLIGIYAKAQQPIFERALQQQQYRLMDVLQHIPLQLCPCPAPWGHYLSNINTPKAYQQLVHDFEH